MLKVIVQITEEDLKNYMSNYLCQDEINMTNLDEEVVEILNTILQDHFSDYQVYGKNSIVLNLEGEN